MLSLTIHEIGKSFVIGVFAGIGGIAIDRAVNAAKKTGKFNVANNPSSPSMDVNVAARNTRDNRSTERILMSSFISGAVFSAVEPSKMGLKTAFLVGVVAAITCNILRLIIEKISGLVVCAKNSWSNFGVKAAITNFRSLRSIDSSCFHAEIAPRIFGADR